MWYFSTRVIRGVGDPEWAGYIDFLGLPHLSEVRTIDSWCNLHADDSGYWEFQSLEEALGEAWRDELLPLPVPGKQYYQLFTNALTEQIPQAHPRLKLLGYDLSDETWTSSLLNCGRWEGVLAPIAQRINQYGLLNLDDAKSAQVLLPEVWDDNPHAFVKIWALFEVLQDTNI
ncbi:MAG: hypothetical protein KME13_25630 [Myxacorys californica WJT36-NPBG1]|jgi:hypothetical protein|nr:hypothetical protein [Myxacorys californica WJT36-NPBG1]